MIVVDKLKAVAKNPKVRWAVLAAASTAAGAYGGPPAAEATKALLPRIAAWLGL